MCDEQNKQMVERLNPNLGKPIQKEDIAIPFEQIDDESIDAALTPILNPDTSDEN